MMFAFIVAILFYYSFVTAVDPVDPYDLSFLKKGAAIGDSYAAGIGAGNRLNWACSRYDGSYANLVVLQLGVGKYEMDFTYSACSGDKIKAIHDQAKALSNGQQFIIVSAGGNDANLVDILDHCVYVFGTLHPDCDSKLRESKGIIESGDFSSSLDALMNTAKSKLAKDGNIYYVGYAKFFETKDDACDKVSWHFWSAIFPKEYLTRSRRQQMNDLVDLMNKALSDAVARAGPQVHFIDYDEYVDMTNGRFCPPGQDESDSKGSNRESLFFYQLKSEDDAWLDPANEWTHEDLKRRDDPHDDGNVKPVNGTLNAVYGALIQEAIEQTHEVITVDEDNVNVELEHTVDDFEHGKDRRALTAVQHGPFPFGAHHYAIRGPRESTHVKPTPSLLIGTTRPKPQSISFEMVQSANVFNSAINMHPGSTATIGAIMPSGTGSTRGMSVPVGAIVKLDDLDPSRKASFRNGSISVASTRTGSFGKVIANQTHVLLAKDESIQKFLIQKLIVGGGMCRTFHPTQGGHSLIANMILHQMALDHAGSLGIKNFPRFETDGIGTDWPQIGGAACSTQSSDTWASRDAMINAVNDFCSDPRHLKGSNGPSSSATFHPHSLDYMNISVQWDNKENIGEHSCTAWLDALTDGCDIPAAGGENWKHGGSIAYNSKVVNATLNIEPLVVRRIWNKGKAGNPQCNPTNSNHYLDQETLQDNIKQYCAQPAAQLNEIAASGTLFNREFNTGTPDHVNLKIQWPRGPRNYQIFQEECEYYMSVINNGCNLPGDDNPMNWKHGGSLTDNNGIKYTIAPVESRLAPPKSPQGICDAKRHIWGYTWNVYGGGFANSDWGRRLLSEIRGCGAVTAWKFTYGGDLPPGAEWHASGTLPLTTSNLCLAKAVRSAGGYSSNC